MPEPLLTPTQTIAELVTMHPVAARVLMNYRMHCVGCDIAPFETIADACAVYGVAVDDLFADIEQASRGEEERTTHDAHDDDAAE